MILLGVNHIKNSALQADNVPDVEGVCKKVFHISVGLSDAAHNLSQLSL